MKGYSLEDLMAWEERIREKVDFFGLEPFPQEFEICDHESMLNYIAYTGMPSHYPHWSFGKAYERQKTLYNYGMVNLPYEMVINANPSIAYLMRDNSLCLQILTMAHVYGHNDFFRNNINFSRTRPELTVERFMSRAKRVRSYIESPGIGIDAVERILDAAHALSLNCKRNVLIEELGDDDIRQQRIRAATPPVDPHETLKPRVKPVEPAPERIPLEPREDLLRFLIEYSPNLREWERDLLEIVRQTSSYFLPQIETKIVNEGWASYWHKQILDSLDLSDDLQLEFMVNHNQVIRPQLGGINPYHLGFKLLDWVRRKFDGPDADPDHVTPGSPGHQRLLLIREADRDRSFLRQYLEEELARELFMFRHEEKGRERVVTDVPDNEESFEAIKRTLLSQIGMAGVPMIRVVDADLDRQQVLYLVHEYEGRTLDLGYAEQTLKHLYTLWAHPVVLRTVLDDRPKLCRFDGERMVVKDE